MTDMQNGHFDPRSYTAMLSRLEENLKNVEKKIDDFITIANGHGERIGQLEKWQWRVAGMALVIGVVGGFFLPQAFKHVFGP